MYQPPPGQKSESDQFPLQDTQFSNQPPITRSPFDDDHYPADQHMPQYDHQPLLASGMNQPPTQYPPVNPPYPPASPSSPYPPYNAGGAPPSPNDVPQYFTPPSPNMHYGEVPRRQPRRYKTSKFV
jgi:chitin synthase